MTNSLLFSLSEPIKVVLSGAHGPRREETIEKVELRALATKDLLLLDQYRGQPMQLIIATVATLSGLTVAQVGRIGLLDYQPIGAAALRLLLHANDALGLRSDWFLYPVEMPT